jgi:hypothetical protein
VISQSLYLRCYYKKNICIHIFIVLYLMLLITFAFLGLLVTLITFLGSFFAWGGVPFGGKLFLASPFSVSKLSLVTFDFTHCVTFTFAHRVRFVFVFLAPKKIFLDALFAVTAFLIAIRIFDVVMTSFFQCVFMCAQTFFCHVCLLTNMDFFSASFFISYAILIL